MTTTTTGLGVPTTFKDLGVPDDIVALLARKGIAEPFPIQAAVIRDALAGRDISGRAPTGSGKTLAFGIPMMMSVEHAKPKRPRGLVLAPTRELADQIQRELAPLGKDRSRFVGAVYGGVGYGPQIQMMRRGVDVLVACPGRLLDLIEQRHIDLSEVEMVVVDEADRMGDMGFMPDVKKILDMTRPDRRTWLFSATLDGAVAELTRRYQKDPVRHEVGEKSEDHGNARHFFWKVGQTDRFEHTASVISAEAPAIVFCRTRHATDKVAKRLEQLGVRAEAIHGGRSQVQRTRALKAFSEGRVWALVATDVAARGIHVTGVASVIHFDPADDAKAYLHRSGRTARAGAPGVVLSMVTDDQTGMIRGLQRSIGMSAPLDTPNPAGLSTGGHKVGNTAPRGETGAARRSPNRGGGGKGRSRTKAKSRHQYWG